MALQCLVLMMVAAVGDVPKSGLLQNTNIRGGMVVKDRTHALFGLVTREIWPHRQLKYPKIVLGSVRVFGTVNDVRYAVIAFPKVVGNVVLMYMKYWEDGTIIT